MPCSPHVVKSFLLGHVESGHEIHKQSISREFCVVVCHNINLKEFLLIVKGIIPRPC